MVVANAEAAALLSLELGRPAASAARCSSLLMRGVAGGMLTRQGLALRREPADPRAARRASDRKVLVGLFQRPALRILGARGQPGPRRHHLRGRTQRIEAEEKIRSMARFDSLTGLANRAYFHEIVGEIDGGRRREPLLRARRLRPRRLQERQRHARPSGRRRPDLCASPNGWPNSPATAIKVSRFGGDEFMVFFDRVEDEGRSRPPSSTTCSPACRARSMSPAMRCASR